MAQSDGIVGEFHALKADVEADLLAMQVGDFYEFFDDDAQTVARELDLKVSEKSSHGSTHPMAGVPVDDLAPYLSALVERGYRVAVADQHSSENPTREITRVVTPGTLLETEGIEARYLGAIVRGETGYGVAWADITTGRCFVRVVENLEEVLTECYRYDPVELLPGPELLDDGAAVERIRARVGTVSTYEANAFAPGATAHAVRDHFGAATISSLELAEPAVRAVGAILAYVGDHRPNVLASISRLRTSRPEDHVVLDATTQRNLELTEPMGSSGASLLETIDHTVTSGGSRLLKRWLGRPRRALEVLERRQEGVAAFAEAALARDAIRETLSEILDLERVATKAVHGSADARDLRHVRDTFARLPTIVERIEETPALASSPLAELVQQVDREEVEGLRSLLDDALVEDPPRSTAQGGLFEEGYDDELDDVLAAYGEVRDWVDGLADREKAKHRMTHLQVDRNQTDGYYLQVGKSELENVPDNYREIKTLKHSKRFTTEELQERERELFRLEERRAALEQELFEELRDRVAEAADLLRTVGELLAKLDVLASLATHAASNGWTQPEFTEEGIEIEAGRHPVVEASTEFVPNDLRMDDERRFLLVTGPNMSGKSTYMRGAALIVLLAQVGSFVPANSARLAPVDGIFTRVGALDELAQGRSTFMVEMQELSNILHSASDDSLVVLDEVGRGTATYDGISIAWAATEYLHNSVHSYTLFATHYHELTSLGEHLDRVANVHVAAEERDGEVTFLRTVREGPTDRSYGIHVAALAGVPAPVVDRARDVLDRLRDEQAIEAKGSGGADRTQAVFDLGSGQFRGAASADGGDQTPLNPATASVLEEIAATNVEKTAPVDLLAKVQEWQQRLETE